MSEPDVTKGKGKKGKRPRPSYHYHARTYLNLNKPLVVNADEAVPKPPQVDECMEADVDKGTGNPVGRSDGRSWSDARVSPSRVQGQASPSVGDHGANLPPGYQPGPREIAYNHESLRQSSPAAFEALSRLQTVRGDLMGEYAPNLGGFSHAGNVALNLFNARRDAGSFGGMNPVNPDPLRPDHHVAPLNATGPNGTHSVNNATVPPRQSMKGSEAREIMRRHMFPGSGGGR